MIDMLWHAPRLLALGCYGLFRGVSPPVAKSAGGGMRLLYPDSGKREYSGVVRGVRLHTCVKIAKLGSGFCSGEIFYQAWTPVKA
ncbi:hypothetical protein PGB90_003830 [Kerria lacca]